MQGIVIRAAERRDLEALIGLFAADSLGGHGDTLDAEARPLYEAAFERIAAAPNEKLFVAEFERQIVGTFELVTETSLSSRGALKARLTAVQVRGDVRSRGIGAVMIAHAIAEARALGALSLSLTSNRQRENAHRFYERLGFSRSHVGFKIDL